MKSTTDAALVALNALLADFSQEGHVKMTVGGLRRALDSDRATMELPVRDVNGTLLTIVVVELDDLLEFAVDQKMFETLEVAGPDHPVLWPYVEPHAELYFYGPVADTDHVIASLHETHAEIVDGWYALPRFVNNLLPLHQLLASERGLVASGPLPLILAYEAVLKDAEMQCSVLNSGIRRWPVPRRPGPEGSHPVALLMGTSYVLARGLTSVSSTPYNSDGQHG